MKLTKKSKLKIYKIDFFSKNQLDEMVLQEGLTKTSEKFGMNNNSFRQYYLQKFNQNITRKKIIHEIAKLTMSKNQFDDFILKNGINKSSKQLKVSNDKLHEMYFKNYNSELLFNEIIYGKILKRIKKKSKNYVDLDDLIYFKNKYNLSKFRILNSLEGKDIKFLDKIKIKKLKNEKKVLEIENFLKRNNFVKIKNADNYYINKKAKVCKVSKDKTKYKIIKWNKRANNANNIRYIIFVKSKETPLHRILAKSFIPNKNNYKYVRAKDNNYLNINIENFEWVKTRTKSGVLKNITNKKTTWLNFILKNIKTGLTLYKTSEDLKEKFLKSDFKNTKNNKNPLITVLTIIKNYSQENKEEDFRIFNIDLKTKIVNFNSKNKNFLFFENKANF